MNLIKEKPILFNTEMVRAVLDGRKTQTRRVIKPQPDGNFRGPHLYNPGKIGPDGEEYPGPEVFGIYSAYGEWGTLCPYGKPGDRLWVRETFAPHEDAKHWPEVRTPSRCDYRASCSSTVLQEETWTPSIFMPRWASRILLEVVSVRVERIQDISEEDSWSEGYPYDESVSRNDPYRGRKWFQGLWDSINAKRGYGWDSNPFVWVVEFRVLEVKGGRS